MLLPLFSYSESLFRQAEQRQVLMSESSVLLIHCLKKHEYLNRRDVLLALANFENWKSNFVRNCNKSFRDFAAHQSFESFFTQQMMECLFFAELYSWEVYAHAERLDDSSFFGWEEGRLQTVRPLTHLLF